MVWNRTCCAAIFTCRFVMDMSTEDATYELRETFHALASQHELYGRGARLAAGLLDARPDLMLEGRAGDRAHTAARLYDLLNATQRSCVAAAAARLETDDCCAPTNASRATVAGLWHVAWDATGENFTIMGQMSQFAWYHDEPWRWRAVAAAAAETFEGGFPWCFPRADAACPLESVFRLFAPGDDAVAARNRAGRRLLKGKIDLPEDTLDDLVALHLVRERDRDPASCALHVFTLMFYRSGYWLLPQFLAYFQSRFSDRACFTLFDTDLSDATLGDGRLDLAIGADATVILMRALAPDRGRADVDTLLAGMMDPARWRMTSGVSPVTGAGVRNHFWKRLRSLPPNTWALLCDLDEFVDVSPAKLDLWNRVGVDVVRTVGFNMVGDSRDLTKIHRGKRDARFNKVALLRPARVDDLHSTVGNHDAYPEPAEDLVWGATALYHYRYVAPDPFGDFARPGEKPHSVWESLHPGCGRGYDAYCWLRINATAVDLFGAGRWLEGLVPFAAHAARGLDAAAAEAAAAARGCDADYLRDGGEVAGAADWRWSRTDTGLRVHPPYLRDTAPDDDWPGYRDFLGPSFNNSAL